MQCLWRKIQETELTKEYKENKRVQEFCRRRGALSLIPKEHAEQGWITVMSEEPHLMKVTNFADCFVEQWLDNTTWPIDIWNVSCPQIAPNPSS
jgi:hypothetical protein